MSKVSMTTDVPVTPEQLWQFIGGFNALPDWHPGIEKSEIQDTEGRVRKLTLAGGGTVVERLEHADDDEHVYTYSIIDAPLPLKNYTATIRVKQGPDGKGSVVEWSGEFEPTTSEDEAVNIVQGVYQAGLDNLRKLFGG